MNAPLRAVVAALAIAGLGGWPGASVAQEASISSSVVSLDVVSDVPDLTAPWQTEGIDYFGGSGVIIEGRRILTNAHVVEGAVSIEVKRADGSERFPARVTFISHDADLALVEVEDPRFFEDAPAVPIGDMPKLQQQVVVYGFPIGGLTLSITSGIVSRIEVDTYTQSNRSLLSVQIDAAINEGNSGGPVVTDGAVVGIAMQGIEGADNVGYMIPSPVIRHFLVDVADGKYDGFPHLGIDLQDMESEAQRRAARMGASQSGALVTRVDFGGPSYGVLRPRDVLLGIDGRAIANDLTVFWPGVGRVDYELAYQTKQIGDTIAVTILRDGKKLKKTIKLTPHRQLVPGRRTTEWPRYYQFGGLVFQPLSAEALRDPDAFYTDSLSYAEVNNVVTKARREIILLGQVLPHAVNRGYQDWGGETIRLVNGVVPRDLKHLASVIDSARGKWLRVVTGDGWLLTLDLEAARQANKQILEAYGIAEDRYIGPENRPSGRRGRRGR
jgi:S1-C subfamily serine protease